MTKINLPENLYQAEMLERPNRFVINCYCRVTESIRKIYLADPGRLPLIMQPGREIYYQPDFNNKERSTEGSAVLARMGDGTYVSLNSHLANRVVEAGIKAGHFKEIYDREILKREYTRGSSRFDFLLEGRQDNYLLEVKSVTLVEEGAACFPDAVTARGKRHVEELIDWQEETGNPAGVLFLITRNDALSFRPCREIDPEFAAALEEARSRGIEIMVYGCEVERKFIRPADSVEQVW